MQKLSLYGFMVCAAVTFAMPAQAQTPAPAPAPVPENMPFDIPYGAPITLERAKSVAEAAMAEAKKRNWKQAIAVVGPYGEMVYFVKMDTTQNAGGKIAEHKASSAALFRRPTKIFFDATRKRPSLRAHTGRYVGRGWRASHY